MTSSNIEVSDIVVTHEAVDATVEEIVVGEMGTVTVQVNSVGVAGSSGIHIGPTPPTDTTRLWIQI